MKGVVFIILLCLGVSQTSGMSVFQDPAAEDSVSYYLKEATAVQFDDFPKAITFLEKAAAVAKASEDGHLQADVAYRLGIAYYVKGDYGNSLQFFLKASELYRQENIQIGIAKGLIGQGLIQQGIDRHDEAMSFFRQAIEAYKKAGEYEASCPAYFNIAISQVELGEYEEARENLDIAISFARQVGRKDVEHMALNKMGELSFRENQPLTSIIYYNKVLSDTTPPNGWEKSFAHAGLSQAHAAGGNLKKAEEHALMALEFARKTRSLWDLERNTKILAEVYKTMDSTEKAYEYLELNHVYKDSMYDQEKIRHINLLQLGHKETENQRLLAENQNTERRLFLSRIGSFLLILLALFLIALVWLFRKKKRQGQIFQQELQAKNQTILEQNQLITERNTELALINKSKDRFFSILSHDLKSPIGSIQQLLEMMKSGDFSAEEQAGLLDEMLKQISGTSFMLHNLLYWAGSQLEGNKGKPASVSLPTEVEKALRAHYWPAKQKNIEINHKIRPGMSPVMVDKNQLSVILNNLISNAIKFTEEGKKIHIFYHDKGEAIEITIRDEGKGLSQEKIEDIKNRDSRMISERGTKMETGTGLGLLLVKEFLEGNKATFEVKSEEGVGSDFIISFPKVF